MPVFVDGGRLCTQ